jgi:hypothetical protein
MLLDVGPNLKAACRDVESAFRIQTAQEDTQAKKTGYIMPESGRLLSYSLKCLQVKMNTGKIDQTYCRYIRNAGY